MGEGITVRPAPSKILTALGMWTADVTRTTGSSPTRARTRAASSEVVRGDSSTSIRSGSTPSALASVAFTLAVEEG